MVTPIDVTPQADARTDAELLGDICADNPDALAPLFARYVRLVRGIAHRILRDRAEAEDVTQEIFLEIYRKAHLFSAERGSVRVWLLQYVYHRALRRKAALRRRAAYRGEEIDTLDTRVPERPPRLSREECRWILHSGLDQLPTRQRATLELTCFEDLPLRDVAQRLGLSIGCTRHHYYRGLERLRRWARVTDRHPPHECRGGARAGTPGAARGPEQRRCGRR
jgi:RNA polymerase sigma-70 factor (ECF subfamily)